MKKDKDEKNELNRYLIGRFLLTLILVGLSQLIMNLVMRTFVVPFIEDVMGIEGILTGKGIGEIIKILVSCITVIGIRMIAGSGYVVDGVPVLRILRGIFDEDVFDAVITSSAGRSGWTMVLYALSVIVLFLALLVVWVLPYIVGAICYSKNVTKKVKEIEQRRIEREKEYEMQRNLLLSDITHDIKTPITTVAGFSKALTDGAVPENQKTEYLETIYNKSMRISDLVSLLFEYVKLDSTGYSLSRSPLDISELLRECVGDVYSEYEEKSFQVDIDIPEDVIKVNADRVQICRAINNILSNAVKYNPKGTAVGISLKIDKSEAVICISDNGVRIEREDAVHIFEPFYRGDKSRKTDSGNGLGLSITKKIVEMHGGRITLYQYNNSEKHGRVKSFEIRLPIYI